jgi:chromosome partitioning protein
VERFKNRRKSPRHGCSAFPATESDRDSQNIGTDVLIIDTAPHSEGTALDASRAADLILVPCQPSIMDLRALRKTASLLEHAKKPTYVVLNSVSPHVAIAD